jgi:branched-subunit amino acid transport protein
MDQTLIFWTIVGMAVVTYIPRLLPVLFLSGKQLRPLIASWLKLVPPAVLAAMLVPSLLVREDTVTLAFENLFTCRIRTFTNAPCAFYFGSSNDSDIRR